MEGPSARLRLFGWVVVALAGVAPALLHPGHTVGDGVDAFGTHWFYAWIRTCVERFGDPSHTDLFFYPDGKNIFADTGNNFVDAVMSVPFQWVFGPTWYQPLFLVLLQVGNGVSFEALGRYLWRDGRSAWLASLLWMANPWIQFELTAGRPTQAMAWFLPVSVLYLLQTLRGEAGAAPRLGVAVAMAGWTYWFSGYFLMFLLAPLAAFEAWQGSTWPGGRRGGLLRLLVAVGICVLLVLPAAVPMYRAVDAGIVPGLAGAATAPRALQNNVEADLHGLWLMETQGAPLFGSPAWGLPLLLAMVWPRLEVPGGRARWTAALLVCLLLAAGAGVQLSGGDVPNPIYLWFYAHLPFFDRLWFPYRFASVAFIPAVVLIVSLWRRWGGGTLSGAVLFGAGLGVQIWHGDWPLRHHDARPPAALSVLTSGSGGVIVTPIGIQHDGLMWQTEYGLPTFGGMGESAPIFWPEGYRKRLRNTFIRAVADAGRHPGKVVEWSEADRAAIEALGFRWVVLRLDLAAELGGPSAPDAARASVERILGTAPRSSDDRVVVWSLSDPAHLPVRPGPIAPGSSGDTFP